MYVVLGFINHKTEIQVSKLHSLATKFHKTNNEGHKKELIFHGNNSCGRTYNY